MLNGGGGSFSFENVASVTLDKGSQLLSNAKGTVAGTIGISSIGPCTLNGKIQANGLGDAANESGGDGGAIAVSCSDIIVGGSAVLEAKGAGLSTAFGPFPGAGGIVTLDAGSGGVSATKGAKFDVSAQGAPGGSIAVTATDSCTLGAALKADSKAMTVPEDLPMGGDGGLVSLTCNGVSISATAKITAGSVKTAMSGAVRLAADPGNVTVEKGAKIINDGGGGGDPAFAVTSPGSCTLSGVLQSKSGLPASGSETVITCNSLTLGPSFAFDGGNTGGTGASFSADIAGACTLAGDVNVKSAAGKDAGAVVLGAGGSIDITCADTLTQTKDSTLDASGSGGTDADGYSTAGAVAVSSTNGAVALGGRLVASSAKGGGGTVSVTGIGVTTTTGSKLEANGPAGAVTVVSGDDSGNVTGDVSIGKLVSASGGAVTVEGCNVTVGPSAELSTSAKTGAGTTTVLAHQMLAVNGKISAAPSGTNVLTYRDTVSIADPSKIVPATASLLDDTLSACPTP